jgi:hypothetical protein
MLLCVAEFAWGECPVARGEGKWEEISFEADGLHKEIQGLLLVLSNQKLYLVAISCLVVGD